MLVEINLQLLSSQRARRLVNITFLYRSGHFIQFLTNKFFVLLPIHPYSMGICGVKNRFLCRSGYFIPFPAKSNDIFANWSPTSHEGWELVNMTILFRSGSFISFLVQTVWVEIDLYPTAPLMEVDKHDFLWKSGHFIQFLTKFLS